LVGCREEKGNPVRVREVASNRRDVFGRAGELVVDSPKLLRAVGLEERYGRAPEVPGKMLRASETPEGRASETPGRRAPETPEKDRAPDKPEVKEPVT